MTQTEQIAELQQEASALNQTFQGKKAEIEGAVVALEKKADEKIEELEEWKELSKNDMPYINLYTNPLFIDDYAVSGWNPNGHTLTSEVVPWDYNSVTKRMGAEHLGGEGCCRIIGEGGLRMLKINVTRNPDKPDGYLLFSGMNPRPKIHWGIYSAIIRSLGVSAGAIKITPHGVVNAGEIVKDGAVTHKAIQGWHHIDTFPIYFLADSVEFFVAIPVLVAGKKDSTDSVISM
jgi:hypothetical protein